VPLALLGGAAEAGGLMWLSRVLGGSHTDWRPGVVAVARRGVAVRALAAGRTVTAAGAAVGVADATGKRAELTWTEAEQAVLVCGADDAALADICRAAVCAALRLRKTVVVACPEDQTGLARGVAAMAMSLGIEISDLTALRSAEDLTALRAALGRLIRRREAALTPAAGVTAAGLAGALAALRGHALRADILAWIHCCEDADEDVLTELIAAGRDTGTCLLLSTGSRTAAAALAGAVGVVIAAGPAGQDAALELAARCNETDRTAAARAIESQRAGMFAFVAPRLLARCRTVPMLPPVPTRSPVATLRGPALRAPVLKGLLPGGSALTGPAWPADRT